MIMWEIAEVFSIALVVYLAYAIGRHERSIQTEVWKQRYNKKAGVRSTGRN